jgi:hypothetical protein
MPGQFYPHYLMEDIYPLNRKDLGSVFNPLLLKIAGLIMKQNSTYLSLAFQGKAALLPAPGDKRKHTFFFCWLFSCCFTPGNKS